MKNLFKRIFVYFRRKRVESICEDIDWAKELMFVADDPNELSLARKMIELSKDDLKDIYIN